MDFGSSWWLSDVKGGDTNFIYGYNLWIFWVVRWDTNCSISSSDIFIYLNLGLVLIKNPAYEDYIFTVLRIKIGLTKKAKFISSFQCNTELRRTKDLFWHVSGNKRNLLDSTGVSSSCFMLGEDPKPFWAEFIVLRQLLVILFAKFLSQLD